jgi:MFS family permease
MAAWGVRYGIFALGRPFPLIVMGLALHGICFDFFFAAGMIHTEKSAPPEIRGSAQALFATLTYGIGMYVGTEASGWINQWCTKETVNAATGEKTKVIDWTSFWLIPCVGVLLCLALFVLFFKESEKEGPKKATADSVKAQTLFVARAGFDYTFTPPGTDKHLQGTVSRTASISHLAVDSRAWMPYRRSLASIC